MPPFESILLSFPNGNTAFQFNLLAAASVDDTPPVLTLPLTVQDGALYLGPIKLAQVPSLFFEVPSLGRYPPGASQ